MSEMIPLDKRRMLDVDPADGPAAGTPEREEFLDGYYRQADLIHSLAERRDHLIVAGSAGAIFLSITFLDRIAPDPLPLTEYILVGSWLSLLLALGASLYLLWISERAHRVRLIEYVAARFDAETREFSLLISSRGMCAT